MTNEEWTAVDTYFSRALLPDDHVLDDVLYRCADAGLPGINVAPTQGKLLHLLVRMAKVKRVLEIGTLGGYSAIWMGRALPEDGRLLTLELNPDFADLARANVERAGLSKKVEVRQGVALEHLKRMVQQGEAPFDFVFIDADKENNAAYLTQITKLSRPGTVVVCDNVVRGGGVADPSSSDPSVLGVRRFLHQLGDTPGASSTAIQTVGVKGWDGFSITIL